MDLPATKLRIERKQDVLDKIRISRSTLYLRIQQGLFVPPISLGKRAVGWIEHETNAILNAYASGQSEGQIKELVQNILANRHTLPYSGTSVSGLKSQQKNALEARS